ncbi:MAG: hypothetical protein WBG24_05755, partial [Syntrophobacteria bacterium]
GYGEPGYFMNHLLRPRIWSSFLASSGVPSTGSGQAPPATYHSQVRLGTNTLRLPGGTPIFAVSRQQFMKYPG